MAEFSALAGPSPNWDAVLVQILHWAIAVLLSITHSEKKTNKRLILRSILEELPCKDIG